MEKTQQEALNRALVLLKAAGVEYAIRTNDGQVYGDLPIGVPEVPKKFKRNTDPALIELRRQQQQVLITMQPGDCKRFPVGEYNVQLIRSGLTGWCNHHWGSGGHISTLHKETNEIEILRVE